jgi:uncharacterized damage-inducible protein DinB
MDERRALVDAIRALPERLRSAVAGLSDEQLDTRYRDDGWTVRQVVHHVVDSHVNAYVRFKLAATEEHPTLRTYEEKEWAELPDAKTLPPEASLAVLDALHARWVAFLDAVGPEYFERVVDYPGRGATTVDMLLELYGWHGAHHTAHVTSLRNGRGW